MQRLSILKADWYTKIESVEKQLRLAFVAGRKDFNFPAPSDKYFTLEWQYAYGLGSKLTETFKTGLEDRPLTTSNINRNISIWGEWMAFGLPLATIFKKELRQKLSSNVHSLQSKILTNHLTNASTVDIETRSSVKGLLTDATDRIKNKLKKLYNEDKVTNWKDERHWKILFSILFYQMEFHRQCTEALQGKKIDQDKPVSTMLRTLSRVISLLLDDWEKRIDSIKNQEDGRYARQRYHYEEVRKMATSIENV